MVKNFDIFKKGLQLSVDASANLLPERPNWDSQFEFLLACLAYAIGLGNVWRFPYLVFRNGGGAFMIPYVVMVFVIGLPIFFSELFVGQFSGLGPIKAYRYLAPIFQGLGYCNLVVISSGIIYYMVILAWIIFYLYESLQPTLGWSSCDHDFNSDNCYSILEDISCRANNSDTPTDTIYWKRNCTEVQTICESFGEFVGINATYCLNTTSELPVPLTRIINRTLASEEFFNEYILGVGDSTWQNWGGPRWQLVVCLGLAWIIAYFCLIKGIQSAGKVVYFVTIFPYIILTAILVRAATLDGAVEGFEFYMKPQWETLLKPAVWGDAASQIFYSFGLACGSIVTFSSYNKFRNNIHFDAIFISMINLFTAVYAGFAVFGILGFMAKRADLPISEVVSQGPGLSFITYPEAVALMPLPQLWAILFFFMMFLLGIGSQFGGIEMVNTTIIDKWPHLRNHEWRVTAGTCMICFVAGIPMVCNGGIYLFTLAEWHTASWAILLIGFSEVTILSWVYGLDNMFENLKEMGMKFTKFTRLYWKLVLKFLAPFSCWAVFIFILSNMSPTEYRGYAFPLWADLMGWMIGASTILPFPLFAIYRCIKERQIGWNLFKPSPHWQSQEEQKMQQKNPVFTKTGEISKL